MLAEGNTLSVEEGEEVIEGENILKKPQPLTPKKTGQAGVCLSLK